MMLKIIPPVIAHRGASAYAPENTLAAFLKAKELGVQWVEFDVQMTADDELIVFHDEEIVRTTLGRGKVEDYPLAYLQSLDVGSWFDPRFHCEKILTFAEMILFLQQQNISANIEIKAKKGEENRVVKKVVALLEKYLNKQPLVIMISSFNITVLQSIKKHNASFPLGLLMHEWLPDWRKICDELKCISVNVNNDIITQEKVEEIVATNRFVIVYTVNDLQRAEQLFSWGVTAVFSDCPDKIMVS